MACRNLGGECSRERDQETQRAQGRCTPVVSRGELRGRCDCRRANEEAWERILGGEGTDRQGLIRAQVCSMCIVYWEAVSRAEKQRRVFYLGSRRVSLTGSSIKETRQESILGKS